MFTKNFWIATYERAMKSAAQAGILAIGASEGFDVFTLDGRNFVGFVFGGALLSVLTSVASARLGSDHQDPSVI